MISWFFPTLSYTMIALQPRVVVGYEQLQDAYRQQYSDDGAGNLSVGKNARAPVTKDDLACNATGLAYMPSFCLYDLGWGSMTFTINTEPPHDASLTVTEMSEKQRMHRPQPFVQPVSNETENYEDVVDAVDGVYKTLNHPTPDLMFLSPMVGNCNFCEKDTPMR